MSDQPISNLQQLKLHLTQMGGYAEQALQEATQALIERDLERVKKTEEVENKINEYHLIIDEGCMNLLAKLSPFASDLRLILAGYKMNSDLERMGDHATNISRGTKLYLTRKEISMPHDFLKLVGEVRWMVKSALDAFANKDAIKAKEVLQRDDTVDTLKGNLTKEMKELMRKDASNVDSAVDFILFSRNLERIGDLATNIAEDVIFISSGDDVRHRGIQR